MNSIPHQSKFSPIQLHYDRDYGDCECCGGYADDTFTVTDNGVVTLEGYCDGHLGGGDWSGSELDTLFWILRLKGIRFVSNDNELNPNVQKFRNEYSQGFRQLEEQLLHANVDLKCPITQLDWTVIQSDAASDNPAPCDYQVQIVCVQTHGQVRRQYKFAFVPYHLPYAAAVDEIAVFDTDKQFALEQVLHDVGFIQIAREDEHYD